MNMKRGELTARIIFEADADEFDRMKQWLLGKVKGLADYSQKGMVAIAVYDEDNELLGFSVTGSPSPAAKDAIEVAFDLDGLHQL